MNDLQPYPHYKPSSVEWLGDVPTHWEVVRLGYLLRERGEINQDGEITHVLSLLRERGVIPYSEKGNIGNKKSDDITRYKVVRPDDIVMNCMNVIIGSVGLSSETGCLSPVYYILVGRNDDHPHYLNAIFQCPQFHQSLIRIGNGILDHRMRIPMELLKCELLPRPPIAEQAAIVRYLDHADGRIRRYISAKERLIGLLEEQRQAVIHRAVTRGLDPDVRLRPSGVEWLGDVPAHWEVRRLKHWIGINEAVLPETTNPNFEFGYLEIGAVGTGVLIDEPSTIRFADAPSRARRIVRSGDTIVSTVRTYLKAVWFAEDVNDDLICSTGFAVLTPGQETAPKFVSYLAQSNAFTDRVTAESVGIAYPAIAESRLSSFHVCVPPLAEQAAIVKYLDKATAGVDADIARARRHIELLREYRTRLIADVITGKLDVREAAENLPDEPKRTEPINEAGDLASTDDHVVNECDVDDAKLEYGISKVGEYGACR